MPTATAPPRRSPSASPALVVALLALIGVVALAIVLAATGSFGDGDQGAAGTAPTGSAAGPGSRTPALDAAAIFAHADPGVVDIAAKTTTSVPGPFGLPQKTAATQSGTGFVLDRQGLVVTAGHVVAGTHDIEITFQDGTRRTARLMGADTAGDVALLRVDPSGMTLRPLPLGSLAGHHVGDPVAVIGDPFNVQRSLSTGIISGLDRTIPAPNGHQIPHAVQTDAAINPGNSGGPVLDARGRVIGIADQIDTGDDGADQSTGVGFAVPVDIIMHDLPALKRGATPAHAHLGMGAAAAADGAGALVRSVQAGGAADRAGVRPGDLVVAIGTTRVAGVDDLIAATADRRPGERTTIVVLRDGRRLTLDVTLARRRARAATGGG
jgi:S1-C subfamily serine protease